MPHERAPHTTSPRGRAPEPTPREDPELPRLAAPREGVPDVTDTAAGLEHLVEALGAGSGPVGIDTERAHGYRYWPRAWLIQLRREGAGTFLLDPSAFAAPGEVADLTAVREVLDEAEWIIHAASQDLPCLVEVGLSPTHLFDTELAGRLLNYPKVSLGAMAERLCGVSLAKEHSAADWSQRPLPEDWLAYAALDVELLAEMRQRLVEALAAAGKTEWARQEFAHLAETAQATTPTKPDRWRRTSGLNTVRSRRGLAVVRELWSARETIARHRDKAPGRILNDRAIVAAAAREGVVARDLPSMKSFNRGAARRYLTQWSDAVRRVESMDPADYPPIRGPRNGRSTPRNWQNRHPEAYQRFLVAREALAGVAAEAEVPVENLLSPAVWHQVCWEPPAQRSVESIDAALAAGSARPWQRGLAAGPLAEALAGVD